MTNPPIHLAKMRDLAYVVHLQRLEHYALGFCTRTALEEKITRRMIRIVRENDEPAGFLHHGALSGPELRIFQAAIQYDARRRHLGLALVRDLECAAQTRGVKVVTLRCLSDLPSNAFWRLAGYDCLRTEPGGRSKGALLNVWAKPLVDDPVFLHDRIHPCTRCGIPTTDTMTTQGRFATCPGCTMDRLIRRVG